MRGYRLGGFITAEFFKVTTPFTGIVSPRKNSVRLYGAKVAILRTPPVESRCRFFGCGERYVGTLDAEYSSEVGILYN